MNYTFALISLAGFVISGGSAMFVLARNPRERLNQVFFAFATSIAWLNIFDFFMKISASNAQALFFHKIQVICWLFFVAFLFHFSLILAKREKILKNKLSYLIIYGLVPVMAYINWTSSLFYFGMSKEPWGFSQKFAGGYWILAFYSVAYFLALMFYGRQAWQGANTLREKKQNLIILTSFVCSFALAFPLEVIARYMGINFPPLIPILPLIIILFFAYAMVRYGLLVVTPGMLAQEIVGTMPDMLVFIDPQRKVRMVNNQFLEKLGFSQKEVVGSLLDNFHVNKQGCKEIYEMIAKKGNIKEQPTILIKKNGEDLPVSMDAVLVKDRFGNELGCIKIFRDISREQSLLADQKSAIAELTKNKERMLSILEDTTASRDEAKSKAVELAKAVEDLKVVDKMKTEFLSVISHELRTPLTPILGYLSMFLNEQFGNLTPEYKKGAVIIKKEAEHLLGLIDSILDVGRLERGVSLELVKEPISMVAIVNNLVEVMAPQFGNREIKLESDLPQDFPTLTGDPNKIRRLLTNLLGNALKFTPGGGRVKISGAAEDGTVRIAVTDNGIGIAKENLGKVFDKFYQVDSSYTRAAGGVGLGLAIAREIVEAHGGKIWAESDGLGRGCSIIFTLPVVG